MFLIRARILGDERAVVANVLPKLVGLSPHMHLSSVIDVCAQWKFYNIGYGCDLNVRVHEVRPRNCRIDLTSADDWRRDVGYGLRGDSRNYDCSRRCHIRSFPRRR